MFKIDLMLAMVVIWFVLYFSGIMGKVKGKDEMKEICTFLEDTLEL